MDSGTQLAFECVRHTSVKDYVARKKAEKQRELDAKNYKDDADSVKKKRNQKRKTNMPPSLFLHSLISLLGPFR
ncbi:hypothetical protein CTI12_AA381860 [Artemisia annua]|uniref:Uncharacterized protein n=1 Tax=Artemisia annua TaxID=35608 RepID=A0A2U1MGK8_ARTAN|nr:hypothetical protein CTI12_AA381860 [Artemisia annua]